MVRKILLSILDDLTGEEFDRFKFYLQEETIPGISPLKRADLERAARTNTVDLMVQKYTCDGALKVTRIVLTEIHRNDLVKKCSSALQGQS